MWARLVVVLCVAAVSFASDIQDVESVVTFARGFGHRDVGGQELSREEIHEILSTHRRHVVVDHSAASFLELGNIVDAYDGAPDFYPDETEFATSALPLDGLADDQPDDEPAAARDQEEEIKFMSTVSPYAAKVQNGASIDSGDLPASRPQGPKGKDMVLDIGGMKLHLVKTLHDHNLIRSVKWGTSAVPSWTEDYPVKRRPDEVHQHTVSFDGEPFVTRPIILVSIMPNCDGDTSKCAEDWPDVFAVSLSHVSTNEFSVNIVRLDSTPNNTWGQQLHIAYVAFEPNDVRAMQHDVDSGFDSPTVTMYS
jgi:hypothetical protein